MYYLVNKSVKAKLHKAKKQITKEGLHALDVKIDEFLDKAIKTFNGGHNRITPELINLIKL